MAPSVRPRSNADMSLCEVEMPTLTNANDDDDDESTSAEPWTGGRVPQGGQVIA